MSPPQFGLRFTDIFLDNERTPCLFVRRKNLPPGYDTNKTGQIRQRMRISRLPAVMDPAHLPKEHVQHAH